MTQFLPRPVIVGCAGLTLSQEEQAFFIATQPLGFILMKRNCESPQQVRALVQELRACLHHADAPILIDMEGGRVARLRPPHWPQFPAAAIIGALYQHNSAAGLELATLVGTMIGQELYNLGINVNCAPVLDVLHAETVDAIGDRAFSSDANIVTALGLAYANGLLAAGVLPILKHLPGHGHAMVDPHLALPIVYHDRATIAGDFAPFKALAALPLAMSSHIVFTALDAALPASQSPLIVQQIIREEIGFNGLLVSDDLDMGALAGDLAERCDNVLATDTDVLLICNAPLHELRPLIKMPRMREASWQRWQKAKQSLATPQQSAAATTQQQRLAALLAIS